MPYKIPDDSQLVEVIGKVLMKNQTVRSQNELSRLVNAQLEKMDPEYRVSGERLRVLALENGLASIEITYHDSKRRESPPEICPVCHHELKSVHNSTLEGGTVEIKRRCTFCPYTASALGSVPGRYTFTRRARASQCKDPRIADLEKAGKYLELAAALIDEADDGHTYGHHAKDAYNRTLELAKSPDIPYSIRNLIRLTEFGDDDPVWTRPLASVKNMFRKDI